LSRLPIRDLVYSAGMVKLRTQREVGRDDIPYDLGRSAAVASATDDS